MACGGYYTGLMLTMAQTALGNASFGTGDSNSLFDHVAGTVGDFVDSTPFLKDLSDMAQTITSGIGDWGSEVASSFSSMGDGVFNGLGNSLLGEQAGSIFENVAMTEAIKGVSEELLGADISVYLSHVAQANSWTAGRNAIITSAIIDTAEYALQYGTSIDSQVTAKLSNVNKALPTFSNELAATGSILNFEDLNSLGNPVQLLKNLSIQAGGLALLEPALLAQGIEPTRLTNVLESTTDVNSLANLTIKDALGESGIVNVSEETLISESANGGPTLGGLVLSGASTGTAGSGTKGLGSAIYDALGTIKGTSLSTFQSIMGSNVQGVTTAQDLLDPSKLFPESYPSLTSIAPGFTVVENNQTQQAQQLITGQAKIYAS